MLCWVHWVSVVGNEVEWHLCCAWADAQYSRTDGGYARCCCGSLEKCRDIFGSVDHIARRECLLEMIIKDKAKE